MSDRDGAAETRTELAEDRTVMANERTFAGWLRTGFAAIGVGVGFHALFQRIEPDWIPKSIASLFLLLGIAIVLAAQRRACRVMDRLSAHEAAPPDAMNLRLVSWAVALGALALTAAIWLLRID